MRMSDKINIYDAKTQLSKLVDRAADGEEIIIARAGRPVARLVALERKLPARKPGRLRGRIRISADFDDPLPDDLFNDGSGES
jgi:prevent-host-death family protein